MTFIDEYKKMRYEQDRYPMEHLLRVVNSQSDREYVLESDPSTDADSLYLGYRIFDSEKDDGRCLRINVCGLECNQNQRGKYEFSEYARLAIEHEIMDFFDGGCEEPSRTVSVPPR